MTVASDISTWSGNLGVQQGTVALAPGGSLNFGNVSLSSGAAFQLSTDADVTGITASSGSEIEVDGGVTMTVSSGTVVARISGAGSLRKTGSGTLTLSNINNDYSGGTQVSDGTLAFADDRQLGAAGGQIQIGDATLRLSAGVNSNRSVELGSANSTIDTVTGTASEFSGNLTGTGGLNKTGDGTLCLSGTGTYSGDTTVSAGRLILNGSCAGTVDVMSGAVFGGNGTAAALNNAGTVAPGNSIGTLTVVNDFNAAAGSITQIELNRAGQSDLIDVGGTANIADGAVLRAVPLEPITHGTEYRFIATAGGINGEYTVLDMPLLDFTARIQGNDYYIVVSVSPFPSVAQTANQKSIAAYFDRTYGSATGDYAAVLDQLTVLPTDDDVRHGMDQLDGELYPTLSVANLQAASNFNRIIADQLRPGLVPAVRRNGVYRGQCPRCASWRGWTAGYGLGGDAAGDGNAHGYTFSTGGMAVGIDRPLDFDTRFGLFYGNGFASTVLAGLPDSSTIHSNVWGLYLKRRRGNSYSTTVADLGHDDYVSQRHIAFGQIDRTARSRHNGWQSTVYQEFGHTFHAGNPVGVQPYAALQYIHIRQNAFTETGADAANLDVSGDGLNSLRSILGGRILANPSGAFFGCSEIAFRTHWIHELLDRTTGIVGADFAGVGTPAFDVRGVDLGRDWVTMGTDAVWRRGKHLELRLAYELTFNARQAYHTGGGSVGLVW